MKRDVKGDPVSNVSSPSEGGYRSLTDLKQDISIGNAKAFVTQTEVVTNVVLDVTKQPSPSVVISKVSRGWIPDVETDITIALLVLL